MTMLHLAGNRSKSYVKTSDDDPKLIQPNCLELKAKKILRVDLDAPCEFSNDHKMMRPAVEVPLDSDGYWNLHEGVYEVVYDFDEIYIAEGEAGWIIGRSSFGRSGITLESSLFDSGFLSDTAAGRLIVRGSGGCRIKEKTRIGQFILVESETLNLYSGDWGKDALSGEAKSMETRYH